LLKVKEKAIVAEVIVWALGKLVDDNLEYQYYIFACKIAETVLVYTQSGLYSVCRFFTVFGAAHQVGLGKNSARP
jgi:hypothetical protein